MGITSVWLPPPTKASSPQGGPRHVPRATWYSFFISGNGYDVYDLYDLGEFDQKGGLTTKWGTKEEYISAIATAKTHGIVIYVGKLSPCSLPAAY